MTSQESKASCRTPGVGYQIICTLCKEDGRISSYEGETSRNLKVRGSKHLQEFKGGNSSNCMVIHNRSFHPHLRCQPRDLEFNFRMESKGIFKTPLSRQVDEAIRIKNSTADQRMNSGAEWRADALPRASFSAPGLENRRRGIVSQGDGGGGSGGRGGEGGRRKTGRPILKLANTIPLELINDL